MRELLAELTAALGRRLPCVYCAVVETRGSTPQKAGAAMLVYPDGTQAGTLGGGCVEAEVKRRALHGLNADRPARGPHLLPRRRLRLGRRPDLRRPDDHPGPPAHVRRPASRRRRPLLPPAARPRRPRRRLHRGRGRSATRPACPSATATCSTPPANRSPTSRTGPRGRRSSADLAPLTSRPRPATRQGIAYLPALPRVTLFLVGGGHVGQAVARLASEVGFDVWVLDDRDRFASPERFPTASRRLVGDIGSDPPRPGPDADALDVRGDPDPRPQPRRGGAVPPGRHRVRLRRHDRQQAEDPDDLRGPGREGDRSRRRWPGSTPRWASTSARRRCRRSRSASSPS